VGRRRPRRRRDHRHRPVPACRAYRPGAPSAFARPAAAPFHEQSALLTKVK
jgi:hypothetical protein